LLRAAAQAKDDAPVEMPLGFDTRAVIALFASKWKWRVAFRRASAPGRACGLQP